MLDGELELRHGDQECTLETGDAVYFDAGTPHSYECAGKRPAEGDYRHHAPAAADGSPARSQRPCATAGDSRSQECGRRRELAGNF